MQIQTSPLILTFGVSDPIGAIGIQADLACFSALGCHGLSVMTGILISDTARVEDVQEVDADWVCDQARVVLEDMPVAAFKVGALTSIEQASAIAEIVSDYPDVPLILDPFLSSLPDSGLADDDMLGAIRQILVPQATVLLLTQVELARMAETWRDGGGDMLNEDVAELTGMGCQYVLVKCTGSSGTGAGAQLANTLFDENGVVGTFNWQHFPGPFVGAGSTLSGALAALMARQFEPIDAIQAAQEFTVGALANAQRFGMGKLVPNKFFAHPISLSSKP
ncbi:hydroxymethylpyrimidine/phosphomethylpyrimidine kinase [Massilia violaceinigra]|uniref:hydroxymethylpyrimidine kinase n=1 Tax=Massilia violaceinigra TaxID=2045208 RepID=A0ABY4A939_9BURK|nr:hydroxymethylpyrimidine/phosphomethylpyrimidine kinase [Massilia violaceinigra]UOD31324.1 hydroxymethylpyrimidine/phosphomethylpyrimidine kinase [Massilia violaceinigra]